MDSLVETGGKMMKEFAMANWICTAEDFGEICPVFRKRFQLKKSVKSAELQITALGVYEAILNKKRVGNFILAPGWTSYQKRLQVQNYDITDFLTEGENELRVTVGKGWCLGALTNRRNRNIYSDRIALLAHLDIQYIDGSAEEFFTGTDWESAESPVRMSELYDGEVYDARVNPINWNAVAIDPHSKEVLIPQEGEWVTPQEELTVQRMFTTPKGERVLDFGQNLTGVVSFRIHGNPGDRAILSHAEVLDREGNFYTENLRSAQCRIEYICGGKEEVYQPHFTFQGFRYVRLDEWPGEPDPRDFRAIVLHSDIRRTGWFECSHPLLNQLYHNIIWGQKGNFLDIPTDCPQRDERLGWTGDAQVFVRTAAYNFQVERFFRKWLGDLKAEQLENGQVPRIIPDVLGPRTSSAWGDAAVICPWQIYLAYGNSKVLADQFDSMKAWVDYIRAQGEREEMWDTGFQYGDWLALDHPDGPDASGGGTDKTLIATAFFANSTNLLIQAGRRLGKDMTEYEQLYARIVHAYRQAFLKNGVLICQTQAAHVLTLAFQLSENPEKIAAQLANLIRKNGDHLTTGFVGTPYLLHVLADYGYPELAYTLLLQEDYPSWLYSVKQGATTIWEHWDGIRPDGSMWSAEMNSFNHYAYGSVGDFLYGRLAGINPDPEYPGYKRILFRPIPDLRLDYAKASLETQYGMVYSGWKKTSAGIEYEFVVPKGCKAKWEKPDGTVEFLESGRQIRNTNVE
jgi:alpha-L-rhamnosidase